MPIENEELVREYLERCFDGGNTGDVDQFLAPGFVDRNPGEGQRAGRDGIKSGITQLRTTFLNFRLIVRDLSSEGNLVWARSVISGMQVRPYMGRPPGGRPTSIELREEYRIDGALIVERTTVATRPV